MFKKAIAFIIVLMAIVSVLVSCANSDNSDANSSKTSSYGMGSDNSDNSDENTVSENSKETSKEVSDEVSDDLSEPETSPGDISSQINGYFDIIFAKNPDKIESEIAEEFPYEFAAIVALGEDAFPTLDNIIKDSKSSMVKIDFAKYIKYTIKPQLYDLVFTSPDENYEVKAFINSFMTGSTVGISYYLQLIDCKTDAILLNLNEMHTNISVEWSNDSKYVSVSNGSRYFGITEVINVKKAELIKLPDEKKIESIVQEKFNNNYSIYSGPFYFEFDEWVSENKIRISLILINNDIPRKEYEGWYIYDLDKKEIVEINLQKSEVSK